MKAPGNVSNCYFVGRQELLSWLSSFLQEDVKKVEECASGHHYCVLLDAIYPGQVNLSRVIFHATLPWEREINFKIAQSVLTQNGVNRTLEISKLIEGKYMDNLECLQWFKWFFDQTYQNTGKAYNATEAREHASKTKPKQSAVQSTHAKPGQQNRHGRANSSVTEASPKKDDGAEREIEQLSMQVEKRTREVTFYFTKLQQIEEVVNDSGEKLRGGTAVDLRTVLNAIEDILYAEFKET